jgi:hypothetical protein
VCIEKNKYAKHACVLRVRTIFSLYLLFLSSSLGRATRGLAKAFYGAPQHLREPTKMFTFAPAPNSGRKICTGRHVSTGLKLSVFTLWTQSNYYCKWGGGRVRVSCNEICNILSQSCTFKSRIVPHFYLQQCA